MARKTAMGKEPGNVSIALPESEKQRLKGGGRRMPGKPRPMDNKGNFTDTQSLQRVSPGVYRNSQGKLVGSRGQALPKPSPIQGALESAQVQPAPRPGQQLPPMQMQPTQQDMQTAYLPAMPQQQIPMQNLIYTYPAGTTPPDMRLFAPQRPMNLASQPQQPQQPRNISELLQRYR